MNGTDEGIEYYNLLAAFSGTGSVFVNIWEKVILLFSGNGVKVVRNCTYVFTTEPQRSVLSVVNMYAN